jgi:hypothetical protein
MPIRHVERRGLSGAKAAFVFKEGKKREDYEKALPYLIKFYQSVRDGSGHFVVTSIRRQNWKLEWWIVHTSARARHEPGELDRALAELPAEILSNAGRKDDGTRATSRRGDDHIATRRPKQAA